RTGVFAAGNLVHPAETADLCALDGHHAAAPIAAYLRGGREWPGHVPPAPLAGGAPSPLLGSGHPPPRNRFLLRPRGILRRPRITIRQDGRELWRGRFRRLIPGRSAHIPGGWSGR